MSFFEYVSKYWQKILFASAQHLGYILISVAIGFVIAFVLGIILSRLPKLSKIIIPIVGIFQTIPGLVFIGVLFLYTGMKPITVIIALSIYAIFPILKNTYLGIVQVNKNLVEAAKGCGMTSMQILFKVELPMAMNSIISGVRMSTIYTVSWAVLAAMIGLGGLGEFIYRGVETNNNNMILAGAIPAAIMAIGLGLIIDVVQRILTPRGLKRGN